MKYAEFKNKVLHLPVIAIKDILVFEKNKQALRNQFKRWRQKGLISKLKQGFYILNPADRKINPSRQFIANQLCAPSYVSLEYALSFYGLIPERVFDMTSVTTKKTVRFKTELGSFIYQHIKPEAFRGFKAAKDEAGLTFFIAEPEKAVVDFLYLNLGKIKQFNKDIFGISYRFQNTEDLSQGKIAGMAKLFNNRKLARLAQLFCEFSRKQRK